MASMNAVLARLTALEAKQADLLACQEELTALKAEVKDLRTPSLTVFMDCLKTASPEEVKAWLVLSREVAGTAMAELEEEKPKKKEKKATTNAEGPKAWNAFVTAVWHEVAATHGIVGEHDDAFKKECKEVGITHQSMLKEASRRKAELEGTVPKVKEPKVKEPKEGKSDLAALKAKVAAAKAAKAAAPQVPAPKAAPVTKAAAPVAPKVPTELELQLTAAADMGWAVVEHEGMTFFHDPSGDLAFSYPDGNDQIGTYTVDEDGDGEFIPSE